MVLAVFDFDGTLFSKDTLPFLLSQWRKQKLPRRRLWATYLSIGGLFVRYKLKLFGELSREQMRKTALQRFTRIFSGLPKSFVDDFFKSCARLISQQLRPCVVAELRRTQAQGFHTVLLSGGYQRLMDFVGKTLKFDTIIGTELYYKNGMVDASQQLDIVCGDQKAQRLIAAFDGSAVDWAKSAAYADSLSDMPILMLVGNPVAVSPDKGLAQELELKHWPVLAEE